MAIINNRNISTIRDAFSHFYPDNPADFVDGGYGSGDFEWKNRDAFKKFVFEETKVEIKSEKDFSGIKAAQQVFEKRALTPEKSTEGDMPKDLERLKEEAAKVEAARQKTIADVKQRVQESIEAQQKAHDLKNLYAKVEKSPQKINPEIQAAVEELKNKYQGAEHQREITDDVAKIIEERAASTVGKDLSSEEIQVLSKNAAANWVEAINNPEVFAAYEEAATQDAILAAAANDKSVSEITRRAAADLFESRRATVEINRQFIEGGLGKGFGDYFGTLPSEIKVSLYSSPNSQATHTLDAARLNSGYGDFLQRQFDFINSFGSFQGDPKSFLLEQLGKSVDLKISSLPADSLIRGLYTNSTVRNVFAFATGGTVSISLDSTSWAGGIVLLAPGGVGAINAVGGMFGVNFSVGGKAAAAGVSAISTVGKEAAEKAIGGAVSKGAQVAVGSATGIGVAATITAAAAPFLGPLAPIAGFLGDVLVNIIGKEALSRLSVFISKHKEDFLALAAAGVGFGLFRNLAGAVGFGLGGYFLAKCFYGGTRGFVRALNRFGTSLGAIDLFKSIVKTIVIILIVIPILVVFILFIINSGAYVVPPGASLLNSANPYIQVDKKPSVSGKQNSPVPVTYTITVTAKKDVLTGISVTNTCDAIKKGGVKIDCKSLEQIPPVPASISPGMPFSFTFTSNYDAKFQDALVSDTFKVSAKSNEGGNVTDTGSASVCFGDCPLDCFAFPDNYWPKDSSVQNLKSLLTGAASTLAGQYPNFAAKVCAGGTVNLCYNPNAFNQSFFGYTPGSGACTIDFNIKSAAYGPAGVLFLLTHEVTHHIQNINGHYLVEFEDRVAPAEPSVCSYGGPNSSESMAEGDALFVGKPTIDANGSCISNYQSQYPKHYNFAKDVMFGP